MYSLYITYEQRLTEEAATPAELMATQVYRPDTEAETRARVRVDTR